MDVIKAVWEETLEVLELDPNQWAWDAFVEAASEYDLPLEVAQAAYRS